MKKMKLSLLAVALMIATAASAQVSFGIQGGVNLSNMMNGDAPTPQPKVGFNVGILTDIGLSHNTSIRSGLFFHTKGYRSSVALTCGAGIPGENGNGNGGGNNIFPRYNLMYLQLPVHFAYKVDVTPGTRVVFHGGPYVAFGVGGSEIIDGNSTDRTIFGSNDACFQPFDFGLGIGVGFEFGRFLTGIGWDMGLLNISNVDGATARNQNAFLTVGVRF